MAHNFLQFECDATHNPTLRLRSTSAAVHVSAYFAISFRKMTSTSSSFFNYMYVRRTCYTGFIRVREMSGKLKDFQGQGIVREFYVSGKNECLLNCQGNVREFYNSQLVSKDEKQKMASAVFLIFWIQAKSFW